MAEWPTKPPTSALITLSVRVLGTRSFARPGRPGARPARSCVDGTWVGRARAAGGCAVAPSCFWWGRRDRDSTSDIWSQARDTGAQQPAGGVAFVSHWLETGDGRGWRFSFDNASGRLEFIWTTDGTTGDERTAFVAAFDFDTEFPDDVDYVHVAVERDGTALNIYVAGVIQTIDGASDVIGTDVIYNPPDVTIRVGIEDESGGNKAANAYWDEFRITKGAKYGSSSFTPEVAAYADPVAPNL